MDKRAFSYMVQDEQDIIKNHAHISSFSRSVFGTPFPREDLLTVLSVEIIAEDRIARLALFGDGDRSDIEPSNNSSSLFGILFSPLREFITRFQTTVAPSLETSPGGLRSIRTSLTRTVVILPLFGSYTFEYTHDTWIAEFSLSKLHGYRQIREF